MGLQEDTAAKATGTKDTGQAESACEADAAGGSKAASAADVAGGLAAASADA